MEEATENWKFKLKFIWYYINNFCLTRSNILCFLLVSHVSFEILAVDNGFGYTLQSYSLSCAYYGWSTFKRWSIKTYSSKVFWSLHVITNKITCYLLKSFSHVSYPICMLIGIFCRASYHETYLISGKTWKWDFQSAQEIFYLMTSIKLWSKSSLWNGRRKGLVKICKGKKYY